jgi:hypothetical protein
MLPDTNEITFLISQALTKIDNIEKQLNKLDVEDKEEKKNIISSIEKLKEDLSVMEIRHVRAGAMIVGAISVASFITYIFKQVPILKEIF